ncbi:MID1 [Candida pseudojiufengensis]|uniref:MID1 n=1 Tax=Candida pseudojiufengensis TaxID=497109 RepID=UPI002225B302|nr:MID1 [Candida pseudojiufengensis]KAI5964127.1 MID1 [Candida pseudojiufengensis]
MKTLLHSLISILILSLQCILANEVEQFQFNYFSQDEINLQQQNLTKDIKHFNQIKRKTNSEGLQEFTPIIDTILQSEIKYYSFSVNTSSGLGEFYELLIFLSGNICTQPDNIPFNQTSLAVYYSFNSTMFTNNEVGQMKLFQYGYFQALADLPISATSTTSSIPTPGVIPNPADDEKILYIAVRAPQNINITASWTYQIGVSQNDLVFQWDDRSFGSIVDADDNSALIVTNNLTAYADDWEKFNASDSRYFLYIYSYENKDYFEKMNNSWCAVRSGPAIRGPHNIESSFTTRNGGIQQQFMVKDLNESTKYIAYVVADFGGTNFGGALYHPFEFETMSGSSCELIYDLEFCDRVAYSVPALGDPQYNDDKNATKHIYDDHAKLLYENFSKAIQQIACDTVPEAIYSNLRTCEDCAESYKDWLCAVSIPRCVTQNSSSYMPRNSTSQRNSFMIDVISPQEDYYEILPCVNVCQAIVRNCPADFGFMCPTRNESIALSYYWDLNTSDQWPSCNYVGKMAKPSSWAYKLVANNWLLLIVVIFIQIL